MGRAFFCTHFQIPRVFNSLRHIQSARNVFHNPCPSGCFYRGFPPFDPFDVSIIEFLPWARVLLG